MNAPVTRTAKGDEELQDRRHGLSKELRRVLILVDGRSSITDLAGKAVGWDVEGGVRELWEAGFVALGGQMLGEQDVVSIKARLIAAAEEVLGTNAGKVTDKLAAAPDTPEGLKQAVADCRRLVRLLIDEDQAAELESRCGPILMAL